MSLYSHKLLLFVDDNKDNTITVIGEFDTGEDAAGAMVRLESLLTADILYQKRLPTSSKLIIEIPKEPYQVVLDGGVGHTSVQIGVELLESFQDNLIIKSNINKKLSVTQNTTDEWSGLTILFFIICIILFVLTIYLSNKNTNKILKMLKTKT